MNSNTGELSNVTQENIDTNLLLVNALSSTKRKTLRKYPDFKIAPLRVREIFKELEEAYNEPIRSTDTIAEEPKENIVVEENADKIIEKETNNESSFDLGFSRLALATPVKQPLISKNNNTSVELKKPVALFKPATLTSHVLENQFVTPKFPKIQCSIDLKSAQDTPLNRLTNSARNSVKSSCRRDLISDKQTSTTLSTSVPHSVDFRRLSVNNVEYIVLSELGKGGSSEVFLCYNLKSKVQHAIKCVSLSNPSSAQGFINEVEVLKRLQKCDRIIKMFDYEIIEKEKVLLMVLEVCGADLSRILKESATATSNNKTGPTDNASTRRPLHHHMPMYLLIYYWMEMLYAVKQIHQNGIIHSDLKPANFLKASGCLKLIDFGISSSIQSDMTSVIKPVAEGSFNYISPEALNNEASLNGSPSQRNPKYKISFKSDVWSLGCILYQLVYGRTPFQHHTHLWTKLSKICDPNHTIDYPPADWVPQKVINTIEQCLQFNMKLRPSVDDLIAEYETSFQNL